MVKLLGILKFWSLEMNKGQVIAGSLLMALPSQTHGISLFVVDGHTLICPARLGVCSAFQYFRLILSRI